MARIELAGSHGRGMFALVDDEDEAAVRAAGPWWIKLYATGNRYVYRQGKDRKSVHLHTFITGWAFVDHVNNDGLDNRRSNLREATRQQNQRNRRKITGTTSRYKGVGWHNLRKKWRAYIKVDGKAKHLGYFRDEAEAARVYDAAARRIFGEFAVLNFPEESSVDAKYGRILEL